MRVSNCLHDYEPLRWETYWTHTHWKRPLSTCRGLVHQGGGLCSHLCTCPRSNLVTATGPSAPLTSALLTPAPRHSGRLPLAGPPQRQVLFLSLQPLCEALGWQPPFLLCQFYLAHLPYSFLPCYLSSALISHSLQSALHPVSHMPALPLHPADQV